VQPGCPLCTGTCLLKSAVPYLETSKQLHGATSGVKNPAECEDSLVTDRMALLPSDRTLELHVFVDVGIAEVRRKQLLGPTFYAKNDTFYQNRLGTNIARAQKRLFLAGLLQWWARCHDDAHLTVCERRMYRGASHKRRGDADGGWCMGGRQHFD